jgi:hypothetical protein
MDVVLRNFAPDAAFQARWGAATVPGTWRIAASEARRFLETVWTRGAELVSATPVRGDLTTLFLEWTKDERAGSEASRR